MDMTTYKVMTPCGEFAANWPEDAFEPVQYTGEADAIAYFATYLALNAVSVRGGARAQMDSLEPDGLYGFCQSDEYGITVFPLVTDLIDEANDDAPGAVVLDAVDNGETKALVPHVTEYSPPGTLVLDDAQGDNTFALIGEGVQLLSRFDESSDTFFADLGRLREIIQALGVDVTPPAIDPAPVVDPVIEPAPDPTPNPTPSPVDMDNFIKIAANSITELRRVDVYRVLNAVAADNIGGVTRSMLADYIVTNRPDLAQEVIDVMHEEWPGDDWAASIVTPEPELQPDPQPEQTNPVRDIDLAYLRSVTAGEVDLMGDEDPADRLEAIITAYVGDEEIENAAREAVESYTNLMESANT